MTRHLQVEIEKLKQKILLLSAMVEESVQHAIYAIQSHDTSIAQKIIEEDFRIDEKEVEIEEECLKIIALHQPVAGDLRFLAAVIKINNDLERVADEAVNIAERILVIGRKLSSISSIDFSLMVHKVSSMLKMSLDSLVNMDIDLAYRVGLMDDEVDMMNEEKYQIIKDAIVKKPREVESLINLLLISRHLERIADHATNIAEEVVYMIEGEILRHNKTFLEPTPSLE